MGRRDKDRSRRSQSLDELEGVEWSPVDDQSHLVTTCLRLRKNPIGEFDVEDLRIMIGQDIGSSFLVPLALEVLETELLAEGDFYPGDLLCSLLRANNDHWRLHRDQRVRLDRITTSIPEVPDEVASAISEWLTWTS